MNGGGLNQEPPANQMNEGGLNQAVLAPVSPIKIRAAATP